MFSASSSGSEPRLTYDSTACASASAPVAAITDGGAVSDELGIDDRDAGGEVAGGADDLEVLGRGR